MAPRRKSREPLSLIRRANILPNTEYDVARLMMESDESKRERSVAAGELAVLGVATVKACLAEVRCERAGSLPAEVALAASTLRSQFAKAIDGSRFRAMWDLGDATPMAICASVVKLCIGDLVELQKAKISVPTSAQIEQRAADALLVVEIESGVEHFKKPDADPRQGQLL